MNERDNNGVIFFLGLAVIMMALFLGTILHINEKTEEIKAEIRAAAKAGAPSAK